MRPVVVLGLGLVLCGQPAPLARAAENTIVVPREPALQGQAGGGQARRRLEVLARAAAEAATRIEAARAEMGRASTPQERAWWELERVHAVAVQLGVLAETRILRRRITRRLQAALAALRRAHQRHDAWRSSRSFRGVSRLAQAVFALADERAPGAESLAVRRALQRWEMVKKAWTRPPPVGPDEARRIAAVYAEDERILRRILVRLDELEALLRRPGTRTSTSSRKGGRRR